MRMRGALGKLDSEQTCHKESEAFFWRWFALCTEIAFYACKRPFNFSQRRSRL